MEIALKVLVEEVLQGDKGSKIWAVKSLIIFPFSFRLKAIKKKRLRHKGIGFVLFKLA